MHVDQTERIDNPEAPATAKKRGRPPKFQEEGSPEAAMAKMKQQMQQLLQQNDLLVKELNAKTQALETAAGEAVRAFSPLTPTGIGLVERYRAEVANFETLDDARKNYALDLLDRLLAELCG